MATYARRFRVIHDRLPLGLLRVALREDLPRLVGRHRLVARALHGEVAAALGEAAQLGGIGPQLGVRRVHVDERALGGRLHARDLSAPRGDVGDDFAQHSTATRAALSAARRS